ncbi:coproporphyrinogen dehydrogenase HemZ, partial [Ruminococcaceae bacterium OttesenSCG-928-L11]|nr:coproporphyrinogen dehydrogenase HemZ [Ruminococcaceae bacterium OttesenSCG-928-L11]
MVILEIRGHSFAYEMECVARLFYPGEKIQIIREGEQSPEADGSLWLTAALAPCPEGCRATAAVSGEGYRGECSTDLPADTPEQEQERALAVLLFQQLAKATGQRPPWGVLTGVRPVRLCRAMMAGGLDEQGVFRRLTEDYLVRPEKASLALETGRVQEPILADCPANAYHLYISIPFCPSRCLYCSFVSHEIEKCAKLIPDYVELLCRELREIARVATQKGLLLQTVYIGGGTPTTLSAADLSRILAEVEASFDLSAVTEFTVEAGRPDTITAEKLAALKEHGVDRVSINPQTMEDRVLAAIGRKHTAAQTVESFHMAREAGFEWINMDLIAGLPGDSDRGFLDTVDKVLALSPENITIHTLTVKRSSRLREQEWAFDESDMELGACLDEARRRLSAHGYLPYYMYRQKGTKQNLENIGFSKPGYESPYNIFIMEEVRSVLAAGAGGVTKICGAGGDIRRVYNFKYPYEYQSRFDE